MIIILTQKTKNKVRNLCAPRFFILRVGEVTENTRSIRTLGGCDFVPDPTGNPLYTPADVTGLAAPPQNLTPALSRWGLELRPSQLRVPKLLLNRGPSKLCYATAIAIGYKY